MENIENAEAQQENKPLDQQRKEIDDKYKVLCADIGHSYRILSQIQEAIDEKVGMVKDLNLQSLAIEKSIKDEMEKAAEVKEQVPS